MAKALMVSATASSLSSGDFANIAGYGNDSTTETFARIQATEAATFSNLRARIISGGSGTNNFQFRNNGADGNQLATRAGTGDCEDAGNTDTVSAGNPFDVAYTDDGSASVISWLAANVSFSSGHGNFHVGATYNGSVHDVPSSTRFIGFAGTLSGDGLATEAQAAWRSRGYTSVEAIQVGIESNARTNDSTFRNRINAADGTGVITVGAGVTGLLTDTTIGDSLAAGDGFCMSVALGSGIQDLVLDQVGITLKSSSLQSETWASFAAGLARAASATPNYYCIGGRLNGSLTEAQERVKPGFAGVAKNLRCYLSANTYTANGTLKLMLNGSAVLTTTITLLGGAGWYENTADTVNFDDNDELSFEIDEGTTGSITIHMIGITFAPQVADTLFAQSVM